MDKQGLARGLGVIGGLIGIIPGVLLFGFGLLCSPALFRPAYYSNDWGQAFALVGLIYGGVLCVLGGVSMSGGLLATKKPRLATWLQLSVASILTIGFLLMLTHDYQLIFDNLGIGWLAWIILAWCSVGFLRNWRIPLKGKWPAILPFGPGEALLAAVTSLITIVLVVIIIIPRNIKLFVWSPFSGVIGLLLVGGVVSIVWLMKGKLAANRAGLIRTGNIRQLIIVALLAVLVVIMILIVARRWNY